MAAITRKHILWSSRFGISLFSGVFAKQAAAPSPVEPNKEEVKTARSTVMMLNICIMNTKKLNDALSKS